MSAAAPSAQAPPPRGVSVRRPMQEATILAGSTLTVLAGAAVVSALPEMERVYAGLPGAGVLVRMVVTLHALGIAVSAPLAGWLMDRWGRRHVVGASLILLAGSGMSGAALESLYGILAGRFLLGVAIGGTMTGFTTLLGDHYEGRRLDRLVGYQSAAMGFGGVLYLLLGGLLADAGWRHPFLLYALALLVLPGLILCVNEPERRLRTLLPSDQGSARPVPVRRVAGFYLMGFAGMIVFFMMPVHLPFLLERVGKAGPAAIGGVMAGSTLSSAVISLFYRSIRNRLSSAAVYGWAFLLMGLGYLGFPLADSVAAVLGAALLSGFGVGMLMPNLNADTVSAVATPLRGRVVGGLVICMCLGQFLCPLLTQPLAEARGEGAAFGWMGGALLLAVCAFAVAGRFRSAEGMGVPG